VSGSPPPILRAYRTVQSSASGLTVIPNPTVVGQVPVGVVVAASVLEPDLQCCADIRGDGEGC
jgi:hypothetical protein